MAIDIWDSDFWHFAMYAARTYGRELSLSTLYMASVCF